jgi:hypothetical protein
VATRPISQLAPQVERLSAVVRRSVAEPRFRTLVVASFATFALLLTALGISGVIASVVQQRRREIGLRLALGAKRADVLSAVLLDPRAPCHAHGSRQLVTPGVAARVHASGASFV